MHLHDHAGALCQDGDVRLVDGYSQFSGRVEICYNEQWGTVQDEEWSVFDAYVVCRQLGLVTEGELQACSTKDHMCNTDRHSTFHYHSPFEYPRT